jgi:WS/DGAT/MGAT family acyltransferase
MDGVGALKLLDYLCDGGDARGDEPASPDAGTAGAPPGAATSSMRAVMNLARMPGSVSRAVYAALLPRIMEQLNPERSAHASVAAPSVSFNGELSRDRAFVFGALPLAPLKRLKAHFDVTLNDLVLALVSDAVRNMLLQQGELPAESLRATIPVSLRHGAEADYSNRVTNITVTLATHLEDPLARLRAISEDCRAAKATAHGGSSGVIELFQALPPLLIGGMMSSLPAGRAPQILGSNLVVSNVRGSSAPMHIAGARIEHMYPMSILTAGMGINVTCASHERSLDIGVTVDPRLVGQPWSLIAGLEAALAEYARIRATGPGRKSARARPATPASAGKRAGGSRQPARASPRKRRR